MKKTELTRGQKAARTRKRNAKRKLLSRSMRKSWNRRRRKAVPVLDAKQIIAQLEKHPAVRAYLLLSGKE